MIVKFKTIKNLAVFQGFIWDNSVRNDGGNISTFKDINIIYGRNYSGKTTLSRIVRALEIGVISDKYENPEFEVSIKDLADTSIANLTAHGKKIRVFNEDFVRDNLRFISNPDESINSFAILGGNTTIEAEIAELKANLGKNDEGCETGFYLELKNAKAIEQSSIQAYNGANQTLTQQLSHKAINNPDGIKYKSEVFGDQNYNIRSIKNDIDSILKQAFIPLSEEEKSEKIALLKETLNDDIRSVSKPSLDFEGLSNKVRSLVNKPISSSDKIEQLVKDSILNRWVKDGRQLHKDKFQNCSFCGNNISAERWEELDSHFDEESEKLEKEIDALLVEIQQHTEALNDCLRINKTDFYSKYHKDIERLIVIRENVMGMIKLGLGKFTEQLTNRKNDLLNTKTFTSVIDNSKRLEWCWQLYEKPCSSH
jgi:wobble nucleotide-excising tRNase